MLRAARASVRVLATTTPLPAANPSAFTTTGKGQSAKCSAAAALSENTRCRAVGMPYLFIKSLA